MILYAVWSVLAIGAIVFWFMILFDKYSDVGDRLFSSIFIPILTLFAFFISWAILLIPAGIVGLHDEDYGDVYLQAISMGKDSQGSFFLGTGYVDDVLTYSYYAKNSDGSFYVGSIDASNVKIIESDDAPHIHFIRNSFTDVIFPRNAPLFGDMTYWSDKYVVYVPTGSIKPMVNMDLPSS